MVDAVGDFMVPLAVGTQTTASTIRPASFCGCVGYRPTWGDIRLVGVKEAAGSLDTLGLIARSVEDIALFRDVLTGADPEPVPPLAGPLRVGFCRTHLWPQVAPYYQKAIEDAARRLAAAGAIVSDASLPPDFERIEDAHRWISSYEFSRNFTWEIENHWELISTTLRNGRLKDGLSCSFSRYRQARSLAEDCRRQLAGVFQDYDVLITASTDGEAPVGLDRTGNAALCAIWTTMHVPAVTLPAFTGPNGLPLGLQLIGARNRDRELFAAAQWAWHALS